MANCTTGIFHHPSFSRRSYLTVGARLAEKIVSGEITNAFAFIGAGGHHAGREEFGGFCCFNDVALCIVNLREKFGFRRFAIVDTDAHHADGTRGIFHGDPDVLHICFCGTNYESAAGTKVYVARPDPFEEGGGARSMNDVYFDLVARHADHRVRRFKPDLLFWYFGFDTHEGDYGDLGLSGPCYWNIAKLMKELAEKVCGGKLEVVLGGGSHQRLATYLIPPIIERLARRTPGPWPSHE
jgi:acetoin utilization deacetylase AcuC-like enzyme